MGMNYLVSSKMPALCFFRKNVHSLALFQRQDAQRQTKMSRLAPLERKQVQNLNEIKANPPRTY